MSISVTLETRSNNQTERKSPEKNDSVCTMISELLTKIKNRLEITLKDSERVRGVTGCNQKNKLNYIDFTQIQISEKRLLDEVESNYEMKTITGDDSSLRKLYAVALKLKTPPYKIGFSTTDRKDNFHGLKEVHLDASTLAKILEEYSK